MSLPLLCEATSSTLLLSDTASGSRDDAAYEDETNNKDKTTATKRSNDGTAVDFIAPLKTRALCDLVEAADTFQLRSDSCFCCCWARRAAGLLRHTVSRSSAARRRSRAGDTGQYRQFLRSARRSAVVRCPSVRPCV